MISIAWATYSLVVAPVPLPADARPVVVAGEVQDVSRLGIDEAVYSTRFKSSHYDGLSESKSV